MRPSHSYYTIDKPAFAEFKDRGSKFLAYAYPIKDVEDFKQKLADIKKEHPKATHHCFAYRLGLDGTSYRVSDDGEPSGSAGRPILGQIDSKELTNILVIVVRYFGGTLLGVPGLINAYKTAAALALQLTPIIEKPVLHQYHLHFDYTLMNDVMTAIKQFECEVIKQELTLFCDLHIGIPQKNLEACIKRLKEIYNLDLRAV
jgi:uncharacterized YigZ family protein